MKFQLPHTATTKTTLGMGNTSGIRIAVQSGKERAMTNLDWIRTLTAAELSNWFYNEWLEHMQYAWSSSRGGLEYWLSEERIADTQQTDCAWK